MRRTSGSARWVVVVAAAVVLALLAGIGVRNAREALGRRPGCGWHVPARGAGGAWFEADIDEARIRRDVDRANAVLADEAHPTELVLHLVAVRPLPRPQYFDVDRVEVEDLGRDPEVASTWPGFFVPVVYTRRLFAGRDEASGAVSSMPFDRCADLPRRLSRTDLPPVVMLARQRTPETLTHELGHFLGLCHTHQPTRPIVEWDGPRPSACRACRATGDGVCDTPDDPGQDEGCVLDWQQCALACGDGAAPDPTNVMSYYLPCRHHFSDEQGVQLRRTVARLRNQQRRAADPGRCGCVVAADASTACGGAWSRLRCDDAGMGPVCLPVRGGLPGSLCRVDGDCAGLLRCSILEREGFGAIGMCVWR